MRRWHIVGLVASIPIAIGWTFSALQNPILWLCVVGTLAVIWSAVVGLVRGRRRSNSEDLLAEYASARGYGIGSVVFLGASVAGLIAAYATGRFEWGLISILGIAALPGIIGAHERELKKLRSSQQYAGCVPIAERHRGLGEAIDQLSRAEPATRPDSSMKIGYQRGVGRLARWRGSLWHDQRRLPELG